MLSTQESACGLCTIAGRDDLSQPHQEAGIRVLNVVKASERKGVDGCRLQSHQTRLPTLSPRTYMYIDIMARGCPRFLASTAVKIER